MEKRRNSKGKRRISFHWVEKKKRTTPKNRRCPLLMLLYLYINYILGDWKMWMSNEMMKMMMP